MPNIGPVAYSRYMIDEARKNGFFNDPEATMITDEDLQRLAARDPHEVGPMVVAMAQELLERRAAADAAFDEFRTPENISARLDQYVRDDKEHQRLWDDAFTTALQGISVSNDGIALSSISHPRAPFWSRVWSWFFPPKLHADALEETYLDLGNGAGLTYEGFKVPPATNRVEEEIRRRLNDGDGA